MKDHVWETEEVDCGHLGVNDFWLCRGCGLSNGPVWPGQTKPPDGMRPFIAGRLAFASKEIFSEDCEEARRQVAAIKGKVA